MISFHISAYHVVLKGEGDSKDDGGWSKWVGDIEKSLHEMKSNGLDCSSLQTTSITLNFRSTSTKIAER